MWGVAEILGYVLNEWHASEVCGYVPRFWACSLCEELPSKGYSYRNFVAVF